MTADPTGLSESPTEVGVATGASGLDGSSSDAAVACPASDDRETLLMTSLFRRAAAYRDSEAAAFFAGLRGGRDIGVSSGAGCASGSAAISVSAAPSECSEWRILASEWDLILLAVAT